MNLCTNDYLHLAEGNNLIPYKCIYADEKTVIIAPLKFILNEKHEPIESGVDEEHRIEFLR
ncbi:MAG: hypothetical protein [Bacteriophage sp.]|jgi:hypothetical protein|nr:MAG: hypothetical protein [Bacteriophage sp.]